MLRCFKCLVNNMVELIFNDVQVEKGIGFFENFPVSYEFTASCVSYGESSMRLLTVLPSYMMRSGWTSVP